MGVSSSGERSVEELWRLVAMQREEIRSQSARLAALEGALDLSELDSDGASRQAAEGDGGRTSRGLFLRAAAAGAAGLAGASIVGWGEPGRAEAASAADPGAGVVGSWIVSIAYRSGPHRTRGLATFVPGGGFVGSVSAYEHAPARPTPSRGTTLHGVWVPRGASRFAATAVRLHMDGQGTLLGVMTTDIAATLRSGNDAWHGTFTFTAAAPDGRTLSRGHGSLRGRRIAAPR